MRLLVENFAKISEADIIIDGLTVIAGENNTGKSTIGKILFSLFNALCGIESKVLDERLEEIEISTRMILQNHISVTDFPRIMQSRNIPLIADRIRSWIEDSLGEECAVTERDVHAIVEKAVGLWKSLSTAMDSEEMDSMLQEVTANINEILGLAGENIILEVISRHFSNVFHDQMHPLASHADDRTRLNLVIKEKKTELLFVKNQCVEYASEIGLTHKAIYIDNPFIIDELAAFNNLNPMGRLLKQILTDILRTESANSVIETLRAKEKLGDIYEALGNVVDGNIEINQSDAELYLRSADLDEPISVHNLSTGMKSFVILKMLLEKGGIREKDVLILDEPEIHLHPQWQIAYAELIVLLQKHFDLSVVVTTHSPYFVDALNLFSCKYGSEKSVNYYLSSNVGDMAILDNVTDHIDLIYKKMASPVQMLDTLRYELNNQ